MLIRAMAESPSDQLVSAMRTLQKALDNHDAAVSAGRNLARNDWRCLHFLIEGGAIAALDPEPLGSDQRKRDRFAGPAGEAGPS